MGFPVGVVSGTIGCGVKRNSERLKVLKAMCRPVSRVTASMLHWQNILQWGGCRAKSEKQQQTASLSDSRSEAAFGRFPRSSAPSIDPFRLSAGLNRLTGDTISSANERCADLVPWRGTDQPSLRGTVNHHYYLRPFCIAVLTFCYASPGTRIPYLPIFCPNHPLLPNVLCQLSYSASPSSRPSCAVLEIVSTLHCAL